MVQLVKHMLDSRKHLASAATDRDKNLYERKCVNLDHQIDSLVYDLYELTPKEIDLIESRIKTAVNEASPGAVLERKRA
jgi:hypothetical protein